MQYHKPSIGDLFSLVMAIACIVITSWYAWHGSKLAIVVFGALLCLCVTSVTFFRARR